MRVQVKFLAPAVFTRRPRFPAWLLLLCLIAGSAEAAAPLQRQVFSESRMGTLMHITLFAEEEEAGAAAAKAAFDRIQELNSILSDYDEDSELTRLNRSPAGTEVAVSDDLFAVLARAGQISAQTEGAFDATLGPLAELWREARLMGRLPDQGAIREAKKRTGFRKIRLDAAKQTVTLLKPGMQLDLGGIAKGYAAVEALEVLRDHGVGRALVAAAGDLAMSDPPPETDGWRVGIESLEETGSLTRTIELNNGGISTSGDTEQFVEIEGVRYSHIVDPKTGRGLTERIGVTVLAPDATTADGLSTAISVMGAEKGLALVESLPGVEALIVTLSEAGRETMVSSGFPRE